MQLKVSDWDALSGEKRRMKEKKSANEVIPTRIRHRNGQSPPPVHRLNYALCAARAKRNGIESPVIVQSPCHSTASSSATNSKPPTLWWLKETGRALVTLSILIELQSCLVWFRWRFFNTSAVSRNSFSFFSLQSRRFFVSFGSRARKSLSTTIVIFVQRSLLIRVQLAFSMVQFTGLIDVRHFNGQRIASEEAFQMVACAEKWEE